jgi:hypothetical protein
MSIHHRRIYLTGISGKPLLEEEIRDRPKNSFLMNEICGSFQDDQTTSTMKISHHPTTDYYNK